MPNQTEPNELQEMVKGFALLMGFHLLAGVFIGVFGFVVGMIVGGYTFLVIWISGAMGFLVWQLFYVIPLVIRFKRRGKIGMMKGVIIGAVITALLNGLCSLSFSPG